MSVATRATRTSEHVTVTPPRWRWYHAAAFYVVVQVLTFGLSGLVSLARGNKGKSLREATFGDVFYFQELKRARITPPSCAFGPAWFLNDVSVIWGTLRALTNSKKNSMLSLRSHDSKLTHQICQEYPLF